jgi:hypothetical protein
MFKLPEHEVTVHININKFSGNLLNEVENLSKGFSLRQSIEYCGTRDFHWEFETWSEALQAGEKLKQFINNPNFVFLEVHSNEQKQSIIHKSV